MEPDYLAIAMESLGGLGLFLLGMLIMTDGLRAMAGNAMRSGLMRFTRSPYSGALTGALTTALLQSSSATTVATVGFVGAGLLTFPHALGIIFGANLGTTITGWMIATLGFKLKLGTVMLPVIFFGAAMRLFFRGKVADFGFALAGFGLIFVGIATMQSGMAALPSVFTPDDLPSGSLIASLQLVGMGMLATIITQSSSAGVAATMTALVAGVINFEQAAGLVIGMDVGTTVTAVLATIGGGIETRRTGLSHFIYNMLTGSGALLLIAPFILLLNSFNPDILQHHTEFALVLFHSGFNALGVVAVLPFTAAFARMVEWLIPTPKTDGNLPDETLLSHADVALPAAHSALVGFSKDLLAQVDLMVSGKQAGNADLSEMRHRLNRTQGFMDLIVPEQRFPQQQQRLVGMLHALDHLERLHERCEEDFQQAEVASSSPYAREARELMLRYIEEIQNALAQSDWHRAKLQSRELYEWLKDRKHELRQDVIVQGAQGELPLHDVSEVIEAHRWMRRVSRHIAQSLNYISHEVLAAGGESPR